jgi:hypothetical protein
MTSGRGAPPLPPPLPPADAARAIRDAAAATASAWAQPVDPDGHSRALSQLHSILRDLGIATRGLARFQTTGYPADPAPPDFPQHVAVSAEWLLEACDHLDDVLAAEGLGPVPDPDEPGAMLCRAARTAITAWRQPAGTSAERHTTVEQLIIAVEFLSAALCNLTTFAPRRRTIDLNAVTADLAEVTACLAKAAQSPNQPAKAQPRAATRRPRKSGR